ncbi:hypothetical protein OB962_23695, partial [Aeromonas piscicola]
MPFFYTAGDTGFDSTAPRFLLFLVLFITNETMHANMLRRWGMILALVFFGLVFSRLLILIQAFSQRLRGVKLVRQKEIVGSYTCN